MFHKKYQPQNCAQAKAGEMAEHGQRLYASETQITSLLRCSMEPNCLCLLVGIPPRVGAITSVELVNSTQEVGNDIVTVVLIRAQMKNAFKIKIVEVSAEGGLQYLQWRISL